MQPQHLQPQDHVMHRDVTMEWWYFTGELRTDELAGGQRRFTYIYTLFKQIDNNVPPGQCRYDVLCQIVDLDSGAPAMAGAPADLFASGPRWANIPRTTLSRTR